MNAALQQCRVNGTREKEILKAGGAGRGGRPATGLAPEQRSLLGARLKQELIWVLISILLLLYLAASYLYWAKSGSAWPISR